MLTFRDLSTMGRRELLEEQALAKADWKAIYQFQGMVIAWGGATGEIVAHIKRTFPNSSLLAEWQNMVDANRLTVRKVSNDLVKLDGYLRDIEARLADGTKWYTAHEIAEMAEGVLDHDNHDPFDETPGL